MEQLKGQSSVVGKPVWDYYFAFHPFFLPKNVVYGFYNFSEREVVEFEAIIYGFLGTDPSDVRSAIA